jgi:carbonic anhydrase
MRILPTLFKNNRIWAKQMVASDPDFFNKLSKVQTPEYLWIGCSDSRVPANQIIGLMPGEVFVHRNIANLVVHSDLNCLSVIQYAVDVLEVKHIIVCGHYGCGGVKAALDNGDNGLIDNWLRNIKDVYRLRQEEIDACATDEEKHIRLCELNVVEQVANVCHTSIVQNAWKAGQPVTVHGWIYGIGNGVLKDLDVCITGPEEVALTHRMK